LIVTGDAYKLPTADIKQAIFTNFIMFYF
jgi:hypothetical protein